MNYMIYPIHPILTIHSWIMTGMTIHGNSQTWDMGMKKIMTIRNKWIQMVGVELTCSIIRNLMFIRNMAILNH